jgi:hypothetical protein
MAVAIEERPRLRRPVGGQALRRLGEVRVRTGPPDEEERGGAKGDRQRPQEGAPDEARGARGACDHFGIGPH